MVGRYRPGLLGRHCSKTSATGLLHIGGLRSYVPPPHSASLPEHHPEDCPIEQYLPDDDCGGTTPTILSVTCSYPGIQYSINDDADLPSMNITVHTSDPDGDLTQYNLSLWVDTEIDGTASEEARFFSFDGETSIGVCDTDASYLGIDIYLKGGFPEFDTSYEWTFIVEDAAGLTSAPYTAMCTTPNENGDSPPQ